MPVAEQFNAWLRRAFPKKRKRRTESSSSFLKYLEDSRAVAALIFVLTVAAIVFISFVGIKPSGFQILPNQVPSIRIVAAENFDYKSAILTDRKRDQLLNDVPQVYRIDMAPYDTFKRHVDELLREMD